MEPLVLRLARHLARPVPEWLVRRAAWQLVDWTGCAVAATGSPVAAALAGMEPVAGPCTVVGRASRLAPEPAARANGALGNLLEMDDVDKRARLHPGPVTIPAALALAEVVDATGADLLAAIVRGYEATVLLGRALGDPHYRVWHSTATCGTVGAAAAGAALLRLGIEQTAHALALAATRTGGLWETRNDPGSHAKQLHAAQAAGDGVFAARCAAAGLKGPARILEGPEGLFAATAHGSDPEALLANAEGWRLPEVSFKPWPACRHAHPAIDAALDALAQLGRSTLAPAEVRAVRVATYPDALRFCDRPAPSNVPEAKFSVQHAVAVTLLGGAPALDAFDPPAIDDPATAALRRRVTVTVGAAEAARYPAHFGASLVVELTDGRVVQVERPDALGDPEAPLTLDRLRAKATMLCRAGGLGEADSARLLEAALAVHDAGLGPYLAALPREGGQ